MVSCSISVQLWLTGLFGQKVSDLIPITLNYKQAKYLSPNFLKHPSVCDCVHDMQNSKAQNNVL